MKTQYVIDIRKLGCGWGSLPNGALRGAWKRHCEYRKFETLAEAVEALSDCLWDCEADCEIADAAIKAHPAAEEDSAVFSCAVNEEFERRKGEIAEENIHATYMYDDGECRIVEV